MSLDAVGGGQGRGAPGAIDEEGETLLEVVDGRKIVGERREFGGEDHARECSASGDRGQSCWYDRNLMRLGVSVWVWR